MNFELETYKQYVNKVVYSYYSTYRNFFIINNIELADLKQEAYIIALVTFRTYGKKVSQRNLLRIMGIAVGREIKKIMDKQLNHKNAFMELHKNLVDQNELHRQRDKRKVLLVLDALEKICNEKEIKVFKDIIFEGKTFQEVADERNQTKQAINLTYHNVINKFRKHQKRVATLASLAC